MPALDSIFVLQRNWFYREICIIFLLLSRLSLSSILSCYQFIIPFITILLDLFFREEKSEQLLDTRQELENVEVEFKKLQQEVMPQVIVVRFLYMHLLCFPLFKYFVSAVLPGFNQLASDLAHQGLLDLSLVYSLTWLLIWIWQQSDRETLTANRMEEFRMYN